MSLIQNLLLLYVGAVTISALLSAALWWRGKDPLHRDLFFVWAASMVAFGAQGLLAEGTFAIVLGFSFTFLLNLALANLAAALVQSELRTRRFALVWLASLVVAGLLDQLSLPFTWVALPVSCAVALPLLATCTRAAVTRWRTFSVSVRAFLVSSLLFCLHNIDFAFLRHRPETAAVGFTIAILIIFALAISAPACVLEQLAQRGARVKVEVEAARNIQTRLLPTDTVLPDLEFACHMRPASSVGGDYFDIQRSGDELWFFLGDVTGHGLGAGLVTLMAQSIVQSILRSRRGVTPSELNWLANRVLSENLKRLGEQRHMTFVSLCRVSGNRFVLSGSHDDIYVYRARARAVEVLLVRHFPLGLGFMAELGPGDVRQTEVILEEGDVLFVGTDGITEAARGGDETKGLFGETRLVAFLEKQGSRPLRELKQSLIDVLEDFTAGVYHDDVAFLMLRARGAA